MIVCGGENCPGREFDEVSLKPEVLIRCHHLESLANFPHFQHHDHPSIGPISRYRDISIVTYHHMGRVKRLLHICGFVEEC